MSYSIRYQASRKFEEKYRKKNRKGIVPAVFISLAAVLAFTHPAVRQAMQDIFFPGAGESVFFTMETAARAIRDGEPVAEAVFSFCREILSNAGV